MKFKIKHYKTLTSTNDLTMKLAEEGAPEGLVITADYQTAGRGRERRKWVSPRGKDLLFTILVRPEVSAAQAPLLTHLIGESVREVLKKRFPSFSIKLKNPNDVLVGGKKICGILVEGKTKKGLFEFAVIGVGLNVLSEISKKVDGSTSIYEEKGRKVAKKPILMDILTDFEVRYLSFIEGKQKHPKETLI